MDKTSISVVYLCFVPYGLKCFETFLNSYKQFEAGIDHELVIVFKGNLSQDDTLPFVNVLHTHQLKFKILHYTGSELDISTYYWAADQLTSEFVFFLNTRSKILAANWLAFFSNANKATPDIICCATGSWQSYPSSVFKKRSLAYEKPQLIKQKFIRYKLLVKAATLWWYYFPLFPNPHIRTNAFFIKRDLFLSLKIKKIITKMDAYRFESGRNSFTNQLKKLGYEVALISSTGEVYFKKNWPLSAIFWSNEQQNLLIADNQTELYMNSNHLEKQLMEKLAWG